MKFFGRTFVDRHSWICISVGAQRQGWVRAAHCVVNADGTVSCKPGVMAVVRSNRSDSSSRVCAFNEANGAVTVLHAHYKVQVWPLVGAQLRALIRRIQRASGKPQWGVGDDAEVLREAHGLTGGRDDKWYLDGDSRPCVVRGVSGTDATVSWDDVGAAEETLPMSQLRRRCVVTYTQFVRAFFSTASLDDDAAGEAGLEASIAAGRVWTSPGSRNVPWFADNSRLWEAWRRATPATSSRRASAASEKSREDADGGAGDGGGDIDLYFNGGGGVDDDDGDHNASRY